MADGGAPPVEVVLHSRRRTRGAVPDVACDESAVPGSFGQEQAAPVVDPLLAYLARPLPSPRPLTERGGKGACIRYVGRLAPVPLQRAGVVGDLAAALAEIPDRRSRTAKGERWRAKD